jgi:hypothetical protein
MKTFSTISFLLLAVILYACTTLKVSDTESDNNFDLSNYQTYNFYGLKPNGDTVLLAYTYGADIFESEIASRLNERGLLVSHNPDLFVNTGAILEDKIKTRQTDIREIPKSLGVDSWKSQEVVEESFREGSVILHFVDRKQNKIVWKGTAEGVIPSHPKKLESSVKKVVNDFFATIPYTN